MEFPKPFTKLESGCVQVEDWQRKAYKRLTHQGEEWSAHRLSYHLNCHPIPRKPQTSCRKWTSEMVLHRCGNKWCINPDHLYLGSHKQNSLDFWRSEAADEHKEAFKKKMRQITADPSYRAMMSEATRGIPKSEEFKMKISESHKTRPPVSEATRRKMSDSARRRQLSLPAEELSKRMSEISRRKKSVN